jgi:hypothetical protein
MTSTIKGSGLLGMSGLVSFYNENVAKWNVFARKATTAAKATTDSEHSDSGDPVDDSRLSTVKWDLSTSGFVFVFQEG